MPSYDSLELEFLRIVASIHTIGGSVMLAAFVAISNSKDVLRSSNPFFLVLLITGVLFYFITFILFYNTFDFEGKKSINKKALNWCSVVAFLTQLIFIVLLLFTIYSNG